MKFALCNEMYRYWSIFNQFDAFAAWGYDGVEIAPFSLDSDFNSGKNATFSLDKVDASIRRSICKASDYFRVKVSGLHWILAHTEGMHLTTADADVRKRTADYIKRLTELCSEIGGEYMVLGSPKQRNVAKGQTYEEAENNALQLIDSVLPCLERHNVTLALESLAPTETNFWVNSEQTLDFIEKLGNPEFVRLHLDCKAMDGGEYQPIYDVIRRVAETHRCVSFHANDPNLQGPGFGRLNFLPIVEALLDVEFDGWVGIEPFDYTPGIVELGRRSIEYLKRCVDDVVKGRTRR